MHDIFSLTVYKRCDRLSIYFCHIFCIFTALNVYEKENDNFQYYSAKAGVDYVN